MRRAKGWGGWVGAFKGAGARPALQDGRLVIAGDGDPAYVRSLEGRGPDGHVLFPGWISGRDKAGALHGAELLALASQHENFGVAVAEAMLQGDPLRVSHNVIIAPETHKA